MRLDKEKSLKSESFALCKTLASLVSQACMTTTEQQEKELNHNQESLSPVTFAFLLAF